MPKFESHPNAASGTHGFAAALLLALASLLLPTSLPARAELAQQAQPSELDPSASTPLGALVVLVVRHAEKAGTDADPALTASGRERAERLSRLTSASGVNAVYCTQFLRTRQTVEPIASAQDLEPIEVDAHDTPGLVRKLLAHPPGDVVVVAGHSNTVPDIVAGLGAPHPGPIDESDYDNLFIVTVFENGNAGTLRLQY